MSERTFSKCAGKCIARHPCVVAGGHTAPHICRNPDCACHAAAAYGLTEAVIHGQRVYVPANDAPDDVRVLEVAL